MNMNMQTKVYYRIANNETKQGVWYDQQGNFTGLIHTKFNFCKNTELQMPYDEDIKGWLSATETLEELYEWFPKQDILILQNYGYFITAYHADHVKLYKNHLVIEQNTSKVLYQIRLSPNVEHETLNAIYNQK